MQVLILLGVFLLVISALFLILIIAVWLYASFGKGDDADAQIKKNMAEYMRSHLK